MSDRKQVLTIMCKQTKMINKRRRDSHAQVFHSKTTGKEHKIFCNVNCKTPNVVYLLACHVCGSQYVGESVQPFTKRRNGHRSDLTKKNALARESTLCVAGTLIGRLWQIHNLYHWPQSKLERKSKTEKKRVFGSASYKHYTRKA